MKNSEKTIERIPTAIDNKNNVATPSSEAAVDLRGLFIDSIKDIYWAENALVTALPKMAENATSPSLASAILEHLAVTKNQVTRL